MGKGSGFAVSCGVGHRHGLDLVSLWLWCRPAAAPPIQPLPRELSYATDVALKGQKKKKKANVQICKYCTLLVKIRESACLDTAEMDSTPGLDQWVKDPALL